MVNSTTRLGHAICPLGDDIRWSTLTAYRDGHVVVTTYSRMQGERSGDRWVSPAGWLAADADMEMVAQDIREGLSDAMSSDYAVAAPYWSWGKSRSFVEAYRSFKETYHAAGGYPDDVLQDIDVDDQGKSIDA